MKALRNQIVKGRARAKAKAAQEQDEDDKLLDPFLVLHDRRLKGLEIIDLDPSDNPKYIIDEQHYQRPATHEVEDIKASLAAGGSLVAVKTVVRRKDGTYAIVDGGQTWRACIDPSIMRPMPVRVFATTEDDYEFEAQLFYILNTVRVVASDVKIRAHGGATADFLRAINGDAAGEMYHKLWTEKGATGYVSATAIVRALGTLFLEADDEAYTERMGAGHAVLMQTIATSIQSILPKLDLLLASKQTQDKAEEFLAELRHVSPQKPDVVKVVALALAKRLTGNSRFTKRQLTTLTSKGMEASIRKTTKNGESRRERIHDIGIHMKKNIKT